MTSLQSTRSEYWLALLLTVAVVIVGGVVAAIMFAPSDRDAVIEALTAKGEEIFEAAKTYPDHARMFEPEIPPEAMGAGQQSPLASGPFTGLRFDRIGYFDRLSPDARTWYTEVGHFSLQVAPDGQSFTLTAYGAEGITVTWSGRVEE